VTKTQSAGPISCLEYRTTKVLNLIIIISELTSRKVLNSGVAKMGNVQKALRTYQAAGTIFGHNKFCRTGILCYKIYNWFTFLFTGASLVVYVFTYRQKSVESTRCLSTCASHCTMNVATTTSVHFTVFTVRASLSDDVARYATVGRRKAGGCWLRGDRL